MEDLNTVLVVTHQEELGSLQCQILQLDVNNRMRAQQADRGTTTTTQKERYSDRLRVTLVSDASLDDPECDPSKHG